MMVMEEINKTVVEFVSKPILSEYFATLMKSPGQWAKLPVGYSKNAVALVCYHAAYVGHRFAMDCMMDDALCVYLGPIQAE
jgi:hypothetical protein